MKIRCSSLGKIMTSPKSKGEVLSQTTKTYLKELAIEEVARIHNKTAQTISDDYKTDRGKKIRAMVKTNYKNPLQDDAA